MLDPNLIYNNLNEISEKLSKKGYSLNSEEFKNLYESRKNTIKEVEALKEEQNIFTKKISKEKRKPTNEELISIKKLIEKIKKFDDTRKEVELNLKKILLDIPNIFDDEIPIGADEKENKIIKVVGNITNFDFPVKDHVEIGDRLNLFSTDIAAKITGSRFNLYTGLGAKLERALINFMLDEHSENGYKEIFPPFICNEEKFCWNRQPAQV